MPFQPCPETAELRLLASFNGVQAESVMHCRISTTPDAAEMDAVMSVYNDWVTGVYATDSSQDVLMELLTVTDLNVEGGLQVTQDVTGIHGLVGSAVKTNQDTFCVKLLTGHAGRSFRGRQYVIGVPFSDYLDQNHLTSTAVAKWVACYNGLREDLNTASHPLGVLSRYSGVDSSHKPIPRATGILTDVTTVAATDNVIDSQNRRLPGRGS